MCASFRIRIFFLGMGFTHSVPNRSSLFQVGNYNATHQGFAELTKIPFIFALHNTDGSIGFGLKDLSPMALPFFDNLAEQNQMQKIFSCCIDR